jgi:choline dehydrogenase
MESFIKEGNTIFSEQTIAKAQSKHCREAFDLHIYPVTGINKNINGKWDCAIYTANMAPLSRGNLTLQGENLLGRPRIDQGYLTDPGGKDVAVLMDGLEIIRELSNQEDLANLIGTELSETSGIIDSNTLRQSAWHYFHPVGTCKMGPATDSMAVVDSVGKVHGTDNLYVIDASIMPVVPRGNTNLPIAMLAERIVSTLE